MAVDGKQGGTSSGLAECRREEALAINFVHKLQSCFWEVRARVDSVHGRKTSRGHALFESDKLEG